jgi:N-acetylglucosamine kinase-like BadF-type ATPase
MSKLLTVDRSPVAKRNNSGSLEIDEPVGSENRYFLGVDGGGTKTHAVIIDALGRVVGEAFSRGSNPLRVGLEDALLHLDQAISEACAAARISRDQINAACLGLAGVNHPIHYHTMKDALDHSFGIQNLQLVTDFRAALAGALDGEPGVVIIAGTGSISVGVNESGEEERSGGWGPTFSDEGSAFDIAKRALNAVAASFDGRSPSTALTDRVCQRLGIASAVDLPGVIYNGDSEPVEIASLAQLVGEAAREGDHVARQILAEAGSELGKLVVSVIQKLGMQSDTFGVAYVGSVFSSGEYVLNAFKETVARAAANAEVRPPLFTPAVGAAKLAQQAARFKE